MKRRGLEIYTENERKLDNESFGCENKRKCQNFNSKLGKKIFCQNKMVYLCESLNHTFQFPFFTKTTWIKNRKIFFSKKLFITMSFFVKNFLYKFLEIICNFRKYRSKWNWRHKNIINLILLKARFRAHELEICEMSLWKY